jgi:hypothetical protein
MQIGSDAPTESYAVGQTVFSEQYRGKVVAVGDNTVTIEWDGSAGKYGAITYPVDATCIRLAMPWET